MSTPRPENDSTDLDAFPSEAPQSPVPSPLEVPLPPSRGISQSQTITEQPQPTPPLSPALTKKKSKPSPLGPHPTHGEVASAILCCPLKCPVCCCDFCCHACYITYGPCCMPDGSLSGLLDDERRKPGCCTDLVSPCCRAPISLCPKASLCCGWFNMQNTKEARRASEDGIGLDRGVVSCGGEGRVRISCDNGSVRAMLHYSTRLSRWLWLHCEDMLLPVIRGLL
ncbi:hypothetical protein C8F01DRAFT_194813 [Mycena amicta]|nr:hypothetical protein C8F01DRAFT_194813 [Mycena amicta]